MGDFLKGHRPADSLSPFSGILCMTGRLDLRGHPEALFECDSGCQDKPIQSLGTVGSLIASDSGRYWGPPFHPARNKDKNSFLTSLSRA